MQERDLWFQALPWHPQMGRYLMAHGLGPAEECRFTAWDEKLHGSRASFEEAVAKWWDENSAVILKAESDARAVAAADLATLERWESASAADKWAVVGRFLREQMGR